MLFDCAIVGGGPAGLNAALILGRARRNVILLDNNNPRNSVTPRPGLAAACPVSRGHVAQRESTALTWRGSEVQSLSCPPSHLGGERQGRAQRLPEVGQDILDLLEPDRKSNQPFGDAVSHPLFIVPTLLDCRSLHDGIALGRRTGHAQHHATVASPPVGRAVRGNRIGLSEALRRDQLRFHALRYEELHDGLGALLRQLLV